MAQNSLSKHAIDSTWSLFLDRDGVINERIPDHYIDKVEDFQFTFNAVEAIRQFSKYFQHVFIVTNQQGIGKELMTHDQLHTVHENMLSQITAAGGWIDNIYYAPELKTVPYNTRKPSPAMALQAKEDFPSIDFKKSIMIGDSISDIEFATNCEMVPILITSKEEAIEKLNFNPQYSILKSKIAGDYSNLWRFWEDLES